tara:strand:- start:516 stop:710 length:195 start_codon:yes stop_codon:yes gene_type:complete
MDTMKWSEFKQKNLDDMKKMKNVIVTGDGDEIFIAVIGSQHLMRNEIVARCEQIDKGRVALSWD